MAQGKAIQYNDIANKADIDKLQKDLEQLNTEMKAFKTNISEISKELAKNPLKSGKDLKDYNAAVKDAVDTTDKLNNVQIKAINANSDYMKSISSLEKQRQKEIDSENKKAQAIEKSGKATLKAVGQESLYFKSLKKTSAEKAKLTAKEREHQEALNLTVKSYADLERKTNAMVKEWKKLDTSTKAGKKRHKELTSAIEKNTKALKKQDSQIGRSFRNVGNYASAIKGLSSKFFGALGLTAGVAGFANVLKNAYSTITGFGKANATLAATLGKTRDEIEDLTKSAIEFGKATQFTSIQVAQLQNELAKLGFIESEIKIMTSSVLALAEATGAELSDAAKTTGVALKVFGLSALEAKEVNAALAVATTKTALSFADYETILSTVGPVAKAYGFNLQQVIAFTGKLKDVGFDASSSATAFRNILLNLADVNGDLAKELGGNVTKFEELVPALVSLNERGIDLNSTLQLTDKRSVAAFNALLQGAGTVTELKEALEGVNKEFDEMIGTKTDNAVSAFERLKSAWAGLIQEGQDSEGFFKSFFDSLATSINTITDDYTSTGDKFRILFGFGQIQEDAQKAMEWRIRVLNSVSEASAEELEIIRNQYSAEAEAGDLYAIEVIKRVNDQSAAIEASLKAAADREKIEKAKAEAEKTRIEKEEAAKRIEIAQEESRKKRELIFQEAMFKRQQAEIETELEEKSNDSFDEYLNMNDEMMDSDDAVVQNYIDNVNQKTQDEVDAEIAAREQKEKEEAAKRDAIANTFTIAKALAGENAEAQKAIAIAETVISTYQGAQQAFTSLSSVGPLGPALGAIAAAAAVAAGFARIRAIQQTEIPKYKDGTEFLQLNGNPDGVDTIPAYLNKGERIVPTEINEHLAGVSNPELPNLVNLGKMVKEQGFMMMVSQQRRTNDLLSKTRFIDRKGREIKLNGNVIEPV